MAKKAKPQESELKTYGKSEMRLYLIGLAGQNIIYNVFNSLFTHFAQFVLYVPTSTVSIIMAIARVWDGFNDPIMGTIVDRTRSKWGKCRPYLLFSPLPILFVIILCFVSFGIYDASNPWSWQNILIVAWVALFAILYDVSYTIGDIPLWGAPSLMTESAKDRDRLYSLARMIAGIGGGVALLGALPVAQAVSNLLKDNVYSGDLILGERRGFLIAATGFAIIGCGLFQLTAIKMKERVTPSEEHNSVLGNFKMMWKNKPFRQVLLSGIIGSPKNTVMIVAFPIINYYFAMKDPKKQMLFTVILGGSLMVGMFVAQGLMPRFVQKFEKKTLYNFSNYASVPAFLLVFGIYQTAPNKDVTGWGYVAILAALFAVAGITTGMQSVMQTLMIGDAVDLEEYNTGIRPDGVFFSGQTFLAKLTSGIATIISGIGYSVVGFSDNNILQLNQLIEAKKTVQEIRIIFPTYDNFMTVLFFLITIPPAIGSLLAIIPTWKYAMSNKQHAKLMDDLNARRHAAKAEPETVDAQ